ncbi:MAG: helix-turn-helix transcriptional regulator [Fimbriimonadaceae bacterium]
MDIGLINGFDLEDAEPRAGVSEWDKLSDRERQIVTLASRGYIDKQIATALGIGLGTVNTHWVRIRLKLGVTSRSGAISILMRERIRDVQEQREREAVTSRNNAEVLRMVIDVSCCGLLYFDATGTVVHSNAVADEIFGIPMAGETLDGGLMKKVGMVHADGRPYADEECMCMVALRTGERYDNVPLKLRRGSGVLDLKATVAPVRSPANGEILGVVMRVDRS